MGKFKSYTAAFKIRAARFAEGGSNRAAAREFGVDEKRIREWRRQLPELEEQVEPDLARRLSGGGRKPRHPHLETSLIAWVSEQQEKSIRVTRKAIAERAKAEANDTSFKASRGWLSNFLKRHHLIVHTTTTTATTTTTDQSLPAQLSLNAANSGNSGMDSGVVDSDSEVVDIVIEEDE